MNSEKLNGPRLHDPGPFRFVGVNVPRKDAADNVTGRAVYAVDVELPGMLHAKVLRSPEAHAIIKRLDVSAAQRAPGVRRAYLSM